MIKTKDINELHARMRTLLPLAGITHVKGGVADILARSVSYELSDIYVELATADIQSKVAFAAGINLDMIGQLFGIMRLQATASYATESARVYTLSGQPFGALSESTLSIPQGTKITTSDTSASFLVTATTILPDMSNSVYVPVRSSVIGSSSRIGAGKLTACTYIAGLSSDLAVTNDYPIANGEDIEGDESLRFRIVNAVALGATSNNAAVKQAALTIPGVADVVIKSLMRGSGSFDLVVIPKVDLPSPELIDQVQVAVDGVVALGVSGVARSPRPRYLSIHFLLVYREGVTIAETQSIRARVETFTKTYVAELPMGATFDINVLIKEILLAETLLLDVQVVQYKIDGEDALTIPAKAEFDHLWVLQPGEDSVRIL